MSEKRAEPTRSETIEDVFLRELERDDQGKLAKMTCPHPETTATDEHGFAICVRCGGTIPVRLTRYILDQAFSSPFA